MVRQYMYVLCSFSLIFGKRKQIERRNRTFFLINYIAIVEERLCDLVQLAVQSSSLFLKTCLHRLIVGIADKLLKGLYHPVITS